MLDGLTVLADLPPAPPADGARSRIKIARLGSYQDRRYGQFQISQADVDGWQRNLAALSNGEVAIDLDHSSDTGKGTEAAGWIKSLEQDGPDVYAQVEWTPLGEQAIREKRYRYISPTFVAHKRDETGTDRGRTLIGAGLTNRPFLRRGMPAITLSEDPDTVFAEPVPVSDSRGRMTLPTFILEALDLPGTADETAAKAALDKLKAPPAGPTVPEAVAKALSVPAEADEATILAAVEAAKAPAADPEGTVSLSADQVADLMTKANAGEAAALQLSEMRFQAAWDSAVAEGRAAPAQRDNFKALHDLSPEACQKTLDGLQKIVSTTPTGTGAAAPSGDAPDGMDPGSFELHEQATQLAKAEKITYEDAVIRLADEAEAA